MTTELLPCPFCGCEAVYEDITGHVDDHRWGVGCATTDCLGFQSMKTYSLKAEAAKEWNRRVPQEATGCRDCTQLITERDDYHEWADTLAHDIERLVGVEIGEHSNLNSPWGNAHDAAEYELDKRARKPHEPPQPSEATGVQPVRRWNAKYPGISMLEHNGDLVRSGFGPYVLAEDYHRLARTLDAVEKARAIERKARQRLQVELLALCTQHVGGELDPDNANPAGNSHHE